MSDSFSVKNSVGVRRTISGLDRSLWDLWCSRYSASKGDLELINRSVVARAVLAYSYVVAEEMEKSESLEAVLTKFSYKLPVVPEDVLSALPSRDSTVLAIKLPLDVAEKYFDWHARLGASKGNWTRGKLSHSVLWLFRYGLRALLHEDEKFVFEIFTDQAAEEEIQGFRRGRPDKDIET